MDRRLKYIFPILILLLILISAPSWAADTYYVKNGGNDSLDGKSPENAWETVAKATSTPSAGDTVYFDRQGTWTGSDLFVSEVDVIYDGKTYNSGGAQERAILRCTSTGNQMVAINGDATTRTIFKGFEIDLNEQSSTGIRIAVGANASKVTVDDCVIHDTNPDGWLYALNVTWATTTASDILISNCKMYNIAQEILTIYPQNGGHAENVTVRNCELYNGGEASAQHYGIGVEIKNEVVGATVEFCHLHNLIYAGVHLDNEHDTGPTSTVIRYNIIHDAQNGILFQQRRTDNESADIYGNLIYDIKDKTNGINACMGIQLPGSSAINVYNNTIYTESAHDWYDQERGAITLQATGLTMNIKNNIVYTVSGVGIYDVGGYATHSDNLVYRASGTAVYDNESTYTSAQITNWDETAIGSNPTFTGGTLPTGFTGTYGTNLVPNQTYFAITTGDAINAGATLGSPYNGCINGAGLATPATRPVGAYDIGAYEYTTETPTASIKGCVFSGAVIK